MLEGFENLDFSLKVTDVFSGAVLQFFHRHHLTGVVLQGIVPAHFHTAKISLETEDNYCVYLMIYSFFIFYYFPNTCEIISCDN